MKRILLLLLAVVALMVTSCTYVATTEPIGKAVDDKIAPKIDGKWLAGGGVVFLKFLGEGRVRVGGVNEEKGEFKFQQQTVLLRQLDEVIYTHFPAPDADKPEHYNLGRLTVVGDGDTLVLYGPRLKAFSDAVESGKLKGKIKKEENVHGVIVSDRAALEKFVRTQPMSELFNVDEPLVLTRIGEKKKAK